MTILAIDPGYGRTGIAIVEQNKERTGVLRYSDCFITPSSDLFSRRLFCVGSEIERVIRTYQPRRLAIEKLFFNKNQKTALMVSEVRGMILYLAGVHKLTIFEYTPQEVKIAITGYGKGNKQQVIRMVQALIKIDKDIPYDDEYDAIAIALTCCASEPLKN